MFDNSALMESSYESRQRKAVMEIIDYAIGEIVEIDPKIAVKLEQVRSEIEVRSPTFCVE